MPHAIHVGTALIGVVFVEQNHLLMMFPQVGQCALVNRARSRAEFRAEDLVYQMNQLLMPAMIAEIVEMIEIKENDFVRVRIEKLLDLLQGVSHGVPHETVRERERRLLHLALVRRRTNAKVEVTNAHVQLLYVTTR